MTSESHYFGAVGKAAIAAGAHGKVPVNVRAERQKTEETEVLESPRHITHIHLLKALVPPDSAILWTKTPIHRPSENTLGLNYPRCLIWALVKAPIAFMRGKPRKEPGGLFFNQTWFGWQCLECGQLYPVRKSKRSESWTKHDGACF